MVQSGYWTARSMVSSLNPVSRRIGGAAGERARGRPEW